MPTTIYTCKHCDYTTVTLKGLAIHSRIKHKLSREKLYDELHGVQRKVCSCGNSLKFKSVKDGWAQLCGKCKRKKSLAKNNVTPWNKGKTKETDDRVRKASKSMKAHYREHGHHAEGKTKENTQYVMENSKKISKSLREFYQSNDHWSLGETSESNESIRQRSIASGNAQRGRTLSIEHRQAIANAKILKGHDIQSRLASFGFDLVSEYTGNQDRIDVKCQTCGEISDKTLHSIMYGSKCYTCFPPWQASASQWQLEINDYVESLGFDTTVDDRKALSGKEIDIYIPTRQFGIECDGLYWHSMASGRCTTNQQEEKRLLAQEKRIKMFFLFHDEWEQKEEIVKSMISHRLSANNVTRIHGRKCVLETCTPIELRDFIEKTHIEGYVPANFGLQLSYNDEIVGACTLRWMRGSKKAKLEIARMSFKNFTHVNGGVSRFIKHASEITEAQGAQSLISYSDNRLGGQCYSSFMPLVKTTAPRFWWTDFSTRYNRFRFRANASRDMSESEVAIEEGVSKIYGSSNSLFELKV